MVPLDAEQRRFSLTEPKQMHAPWLKLAFKSYDTMRCGSTTGALQNLIVQGLTAETEDRADEDVKIRTMLPK